jgi:hypothetical protein
VTSTEKPWPAQQRRSKTTVPPPAAGASRDISPIASGICGISGSTLERVSVSLSTMTSRLSSSRATDGNVMTPSSRRDGGRATAIAATAVRDRMGR